MSSTCTGSEKHHRDSPSLTMKHQEMIQKVMQIAGDNNPFSYASESLTTLLSQKVVPPEIEKSLLQAEDHERATLLKFQQERLETDFGSPWDVLHRLPVKTFKNLVKKTIVAVAGEKMAVAGSTDFTRRVLLAVQMNANLDVRELMINYELSAYLLALFDEHGDLWVTAKSALLNVIKPSCTDPTSPSCVTSSHRFLSLDGMALLQMFPVGGAKTFKELCKVFFEMITRRSTDYQEVHLVFGRYDI